MIRSILVTVLTISLTCVFSGCTNKAGGFSAEGCRTRCGKGAKWDTSRWTAFGEKMSPAAGQPICTSDILAHKTKYANKTIHVCGKVDSVCAHKGCWIRLAGPTTSETIFVKFTCPVNGRLVPMEAKGRFAIVEGTLELKRISEEEARHYAEDEGASATEIAKIRGPQQIIKINSPAAIIDLTDKAASTG